MRSNDAFDRVMKTVTKIREQGEKPEEDIYSMDKFVCDLCQGDYRKKEITQCGFCGRWVCKETCWDNNLRSCESCSGLIKLAKSEETGECGTDEKDR